MVSLGPHSAVWIPYGFATIVIHTPTEEQNQKSKADQGLALAVGMVLGILIQGVVSAGVAEDMGSDRDVE